MVDVPGQVRAAAFLAALDDHYTARMRDSLLLQYPDGRERRERRVAVVRAAAPIEPLAAQHRRPGAESLVPAGHLRLLVHMAVEQDGVVDLARNLDEKQRRSPRQLDDLELHAVRRMRPAPLDDESHCVVHVAVAGPVRIEIGRLVRDPDVVDERWNDRLVELARDERLRLPCVDHLVHGHGHDSTCSCGRGATPKASNASAERHARRDDQSPGPAALDLILRQS